MKPTLRAASAAAVCTALALTAAACGSSAGSASSSGGSKEVTVYSADGLKGENGDGWYDKVFADFTKETGIKVDYVEGGSGEIVQRAVREKTNTQADVIVTLPPFIQQADEKGLLAAYTPKNADKVTGDVLKDAGGRWTTVLQNYLCFIRNTKELPTAPKTWDDLLDAKFKNKLQYSTPGVAGDGTGVVIKNVHDLGGQAQSMAYLAELQKNNVGPSSSTGKLAAKVNKGELLVANGDVQMSYAQSKSEDPNIGIWFPAGRDGKPSTFALPYAAGLTAKAPHADAGKKLLDFMLADTAQREATTIGGGYPARSDIKPSGAAAADLAKIMNGVEVFDVDWKQVNSDLPKWIAAWQAATGS